MWSLLPGRVAPFGKYSYKFSHKRHAAEFEKLHRDLIAEFTPNGPFENDIVATVARVLWRKQNLETFHSQGWRLAPALLV